MPIYEYKCCDCGHQFEELVFSRDECPPCPACKSAKTGKLLSACRFKTGGGDFGGDYSAPTAPASSGGG